MTWLRKGGRVSRSTPRTKVPLALSMIGATYYAPTASVMVFAMSALRKRTLAGSNLTASEKP